MPVRQEARRRADRVQPQAAWLGEEPLLSGAWSRWGSSQAKTLMRGFRFGGEDSGVRTSEVAVYDPVQQRGEALAVRTCHMRPLRQMVALHLGIVLEVNARRRGGSEQRVPGSCTREILILVFEIWPYAGHTHEQHFHTAGAKLRDRFRHPLDLFLLDLQSFGGRRLIVGRRPNPHPQVAFRRANLPICVPPAPNAQDPAAPRLGAV